MNKLVVHIHTKTNTHGKYESTDQNGWSYGKIDHQLACRWLEASKIVLVVTAEEAIKVMMVHRWWLIICVNVILSLKIDETRICSAGSSG
jgi:hypothetical protein